MELGAIQSGLQAILKEHVPPLRIRMHDSSVMEFCGAKAAQEGEGSVGGYYFASIIPKSKEVRLYFFPMHTHGHEFQRISASLRNCFHGKSCFRFKKWDAKLEKDIRAMVGKGVKLYQKANLI